MLAVNKHLQTISRECGSKDLTGPLSLETPQPAYRAIN
jgi:hypothetical protein